MRGGQGKAPGGEVVMDGAPSALRCSLCCVDEVQTSSEPCENLLAGVSYDKC